MIAMFPIFMIVSFSSTISTEEAWSQGYQDSDYDGISDEIDECPQDPETYNKFEDTDGCPDSASEERTQYHFPDTDGDGIEDRWDSCIFYPEIYNDYLDYDGCPERELKPKVEVDSDFDTIIDSIDACPQEQETFNDFKDGDGCPDSLDPTIPNASKRSPVSERQCTGDKIAVLRINTNNFVCVTLDTAVKWKELGIGEIVSKSMPGEVVTATEEEKIEFGSELQETLGHFWALEQNLDENNAELALVHATHPIAELYSSMSEKLADNPEFDAKLQQTLMGLQNKANTEVTREEAQQAIDEAKAIVTEAQDIVIGDLANDDAFKAQLANILLETSKVEYAEAIKDGIIEEMAEFQDGSAFVWRAKELLATMKIDPVIESHILSNIVKVEEAYDQRASPSEVSGLVDIVIEDFEVISGVQSSESEHMEVAFPSPRHQLNSGVSPNEIECKPELILVLNNNDSRPACVSESGADKLESFSWGTRA